MKATEIYFIVGDIREGNGTERVVSCIANSLAKDSKLKISIISCSNEGQQFFNTIDNIDIIFLGKKGLGNRAGILTSIIWHLHLIWILAKFFKKKTKTKNHKITIGTWTNLNCALALLPATFGGRKIGWEHISFEAPRYPWQFMRRLVYWRLWKVFCLTDVDLPKFRKINRGSFVLQNPVSPDFELAQWTRAQKTFLSAGRFTEQKGFDLLIEAFAKAAPNLEGWKLRIIGDGPLRESLEKLIESYGLHESIKLERPRNDLQEAFVNSGIFVLPSRYEGLPMVLIEAITVGIPCIAFDCPTGPREIFTNSNGMLVGFLVESGDTDKLANALISLSRNDQHQKELSENGRIQARTRFSLQQITILWKTHLAIDTHQDVPLRPDEAL